MSKFTDNHFNRDQLLLPFVITTAIFSTLFNVVCYVIGYKSGSIIMAADLILFLVIIFLIKKTKISHLYLSHFFMINCTATVALLSVFHSGGIYSPFLITYIMLALITVLLFGRTKASWFWLMVFIIVIVLIAFTNQYDKGFQKEYNENYNVFFYTVCLLGVPLCTFFIATIFERAKETSFRILQENQALLISNEEKDLLIKEIHHRVKNNLQIISSLVNLQIDEISDKKTIDILNVTKNRIYSLSLIHQKLFTGNNTGTVNFKDHIVDLIKYQRNTFPIIDYSVKGINVDLSLDQATPLSLIASELIMNSFKHAFDGPRKPELSILISKKEGDKCELKIKDNGKGLPENFDLQTSSSLGMEIVKSLIIQIDAEINYNSSKEGTEFNILFNIK